MGLSNSPTDICNMALDLIGQPPIASISPPSTANESLCARWYDRVRRMLLREHTWNFAKDIVNCSRDSSITPVSDFTDAYHKPIDFIRLLSVDGEKEIWQGRDYDIHGKYIVMNKDAADSIILRYIKDVTDISQWDAHCVMDFVHYMALYLAYPVTKKKAVVEMVLALIKESLPLSVSIDGQEVPPRRIQRSKYLAARLGYTDTLQDDPRYIHLP